MSDRATAHHFLGAGRSAHIKALVLTFALCVLAGLVLFVWSQLHAEADQSKSQAALLARVLEDQTAKTFENTEMALSSLAHHPAILAAGSTRSTREAAMAQLIAQLPYLRSMALLDDKGLILASTQAGEAGQQIDMQELLHDKSAVVVPGKPCWAGWCPAVACRPWRPARTRRRAACRFCRSCWAFTRTTACPPCWWP